MEEFEKVNDTIEFMKGLSESERHQVIIRLLDDEYLDIPTLVSIHAGKLQEFKHKAQNDIRKLSQAGLTLLQHDIKKIKSIKSENKRHLHMALAKTLIDGRGYLDTEFQKKLLEDIDMTGVDMDWYKECWQLETIKEKK